MFKHSMVRSLLQLTGLCVVALFLSTASPKAATTQGFCASAAATAAAHCGDTITPVWVYRYYCGPCNNYVDYYTYSWGPGVANFECEEENDTYSYQCVY
jgi:hypothetical protein